MKKRLIIIIAVVLFVALAVLIYNFLRREKETIIPTAGIIEGTEVNLSPRVSGRISYLCCREGEKIIEGSVAVRLENEDLSASVRQAGATLERARTEVKSAEAAVQAARANEKGADAKIASGAADVKLYESHTEEALRELKRAEALFKDGFVTKADLDLKRTGYDTAQAGLEAARARLEALLAEKEALKSALVGELGRYDSARASVKEASANLSVWRAKLAETVIKSPINGTVVYRAAEPGEVVAAGTAVLTIIDENDLWVRTGVEETYIPSIGLGGKASVVVGGKAYEGTVIEIGRYAEFATQKDVLRGRQDIRTFRVKVTVNDPQKNLKPGMTAEVAFVPLAGP